MLESLSTSYLSRVDPHLFSMTTTPPSSPVITGYETSEQRETEIQRAQWRERDEVEKKVHRVVLESYEAPIREYKRFMARDRRTAVKAESRVLGESEDEPRFRSWNRADGNDNGRPTRSPTPTLDPRPPSALTRPVYNLPLRHRRALYKFFLLPHPNGHPSKYRRNPLNPAPPETPEDIDHPPSRRPE